jgi:hypothetical protein
MRTLSSSVAGSRVMSAIQAAQQPIAVAVAGGGAVPQPWQVRGQGAQRVMGGRGRGGGLCGGQRCFGVGELGQFSLPPRFQAAGHEPVLGFDVGEGAFRAVGFVAGALYREFGGPVAAHPAIGDFVAGGQRDGDLLLGDGVEEQGADGRVDGGRDHRAALRGADRVFDLAV